MSGTTLSRPDLETNIVANVYQNTQRKITGTRAQQTLLNMSASMLNITTDRDVAGGYLGISEQLIVDISFIKKQTPTGQFLQDNGTWGSPSGGVTGSGTANYVAKFSAGTVLTNSTIFDNGASVSIGAATLNIQSTLTDFGGNDIQDVGSLSVSASGFIELNVSAQIRSNTGTGTHLDFGAGGNSFNVNTKSDNTGSAINLTETDATIGAPNGSILFTASTARLSHATQYIMWSPIFEWSTDSGALAQTYIRGTSTTLTLSSDDVTVAGDTVNVGVDATVIYVGTGAGAKVINVGGAGDTINILGSVVNEYATNAYVTDKLITLNDGGGIATGIGVGFEIEENGAITGYFKTNGTRSGYVMLSPAIVYSANLSLSLLTADRLLLFPDGDGTFIYDGGSYADPAWITSLAYAKLTGAPTQYWTDGTTYLTPFAARDLMAGTAANVSIGYGTVPSGTRLSIIGAGNTSATYALRIENSSNLFSLQVRDDGSVYNYGKGGVTSNTVFGDLALGSNTTGAENTAFGRSSLAAVTTGSSNTAIGRNSLAGLTTGSYNFGLGTDALLWTTLGSYNVGIGYKAGYLNGTTGTNNYNIFIGQSAGYSETQTSGTVIIHPGNDVGYFLTDGNIKIGNGGWTTAVHDIYNNIAIGNNASRLNHANDVIAIGGGANAYNSTGTQVVSIGTASGGAGNWGTPFGASYFVAVGYGALGSNTGNYNVAIGRNAGAANTSGTNNVFIGSGATASAGNFTNAIAIGDSAVVGASNSMVLGSGVKVGIGTSVPGSMLHIKGIGSTLADDGIRFSQPNVAHGMTGVVPTDVYGFISWVNSGDGGLIIRGLTDADGYGVDIGGTNGATSPTIAAVRIRGSKKSGTSHAALAATEKLVEFSNTTTTVVATLMADGKLGLGSTGSPLSVLEIVGSGAGGTSVDGIRFRQPNVAHGMISVVPTDVYGFISWANSTAGGLTVRGYSDADNVGLTLIGYNGSSSPTGSAIALAGGKKNTTTVQALAAGEKLYELYNNATVVQTILGDGRAYFGGTASPTALIELATGTTTIAPQKFTSSGTGVTGLLTTAEKGAMEFTDRGLWFSPAASTRHKVLHGLVAAAAPTTSAVGVIVDYFGTSATRVLTTPNTWISVVGDDGNTYKIPGYS